MTPPFEPRRDLVTPENRNGWFIVIGFLLIIAAFLFFLVTRENFSIELVLAWAAAFVAVLFIWVQWKKTDEA